MEATTVRLFVPLGKGERLAATIVGRFEEALMATIAERAENAARAHPAKRGRDAETPAEIPAHGWREIAFRTWKESAKDNVSLVAAGVAFYGFLAIVPLLGATVLTYGLIASPNTVLHNVQSLATAMPKDVAKLIGDQLLSVVNTSSGKKGIGVFIALVLALWGARNAAGSIVIALNIAYEEDEKRGWFKVTLLSLGITATGVVLAMIGAAAVGSMTRMERMAPHLGPVGVIGGKILAYLLLGAVAAAAAATLYRYGPSRERAKWTWITPGSLFFAVGWVVLTLGFGFYVSHFARYNVTYGSLGGVIVLVTWLYLSSFILLYGGEFNSEIEHQTARDTTVVSGERPLGSRGAWSADHVADGPGDEGKEAGQAAEQPLSDDPEARPEPPNAPTPPQAPEVPRPPTSPQAPKPGNEHAFLISRTINRAAGIAGLRTVGIVSAALSTIGLSLLRKRGREGAGVALLATAAGLSLLRRER